MIYKDIKIFNELCHQHHHQPINAPHCWGTGLPYGLHIGRTGHNPYTGPAQVGELCQVRENVLYQNIIKIIRSR
jgi:hypothetical protein